jgi:hypothetical protein
MQRPDGLTSARVTASQQADADGEAPGAPVWASHAELRAGRVRDAVEATLRQRARRQGFWLLIASSATMIALIVGIWLLFR